MRVFVTGGIGVVGKALLERLVEHGWEVRVVDRNPDFDKAKFGVEKIDYQVADITNYDDIREKMRGCDVVVHLAAIADPMFVAPHELFQINVQGTYNVYEAAAELGIKRIVQASSINAIGCFWGNRDIFPAYFPLDEEHPTATTDVYSFSKELVEDIGAYYWRRKGISSISLRFPGVWSRTRISGDDVKTHRQNVVAVLDEFASQSEAVRAERLATVRKTALEFRGAGHMEYPQAQMGLGRSGYSNDPLWPVYTFDRFNFWAYVDERDSAQALEKGLTAPFEGHHPLFINAADNSLGYDSTKLVKLLFPETNELKRTLHGSESLVSTQKSKELIGYSPEHSI